MAKTHKRISIFGLCISFALTVLVLFSVSASNSVRKQPDKSQRNQQDIARVRQEFQARFPTTDYDSAEPTNPEEKAKRKNRNKHYDGKHLVTGNPYNSTTGVTEVDELFYNLPALPVSQSGVILTADVLNSESHLSNNKKAVYSEFSVQVDAVLKGTVPTLSQTNLISVSRVGGTVRYPSGQKVLYSIASQNMPALGKRYLFFLKATDDMQAYEIITAYQIGPDGVLALDDGPNFKAYNGTDLAVFLKAVRDAIAGKN